MNKMKLLLLPIIASMMLVIASPVGVLAQTNRDEVCDGLRFTGGNCATGGTEVENIIKTVIDVLSWVVGIIAVIMIIIGGLKYITSSGDANNVSSAKNTILYAIIGLVVVLLAQVIVGFVINTAT